jgi:hypothetical protein
LPNPAKSVSAAAEADDSIAKALTQVEVFHHVVGTDSARHLRSVRHPLIKTANDVYAQSLTSLYVTNDHYYREGFMRHLEDFYFGAKWTNVIHVKISDLSPPINDPSASIDASVALSGLHNNNGLGHGKSAAEILVVSCVSSTLHLGQLSSDETIPAINITESVELDSLIDNPTYFDDPFADESFDASGYVLAGLTRPITLAKTLADPSIPQAVTVWYVKPVKDPKSPVRWERRVLFEDDGRRISSASAGVLVAIDPKLEGGKRKAWLYIGGFISDNIIAVKVDL